MFHEARRGFSTPSGYATDSDGQASKTPRGTSIGKGKTATASGSRAKQPSTAPKYSLTGAAAVRRRTELGTSLRAKPNLPSSEILMLM